MWNTEFGLGRLVSMIMPKTRLYFGWETLAAPVVAGAVGKLLGGGDGGAKEMNRASAELARFQANAGKEMLDRQKNTFWPLQDKIIADAESFGGLDDQEREAGLAGDQVSRAAADSRSALTRNLNQFGVNPTDGRFADSFARLERDSTLADAAARNAARIGTRELGMSRRVAAAGMGDNLGWLGQMSVGSAANTLGGLANTNNALQRQRQTDAGFLLQPAIKEGLGALKGVDWGGMFKTNSSMPVGLSSAVKGYAKGGKVKAYADGGMVEGPDPAETADNVPILASHNEFVVNAEGARILGRDVIEAANLLGTMRRAAKEAKAAKSGRKMMHGGQVPAVGMKMVGYRSGGHVVDPQSTLGDLPRKPIAGLRTTSGAPVLQRDFGGAAPSVAQSATQVSAPVGGASPAQPNPGADPMGGAMMDPASMPMGGAPLTRGFAPRQIAPMELDDIGVTYIDMEPVTIRGKANDRSTWDFSGLNDMKIKRIRHGVRP